MFQGLATPSQRRMVRSFEYILSTGASPTGIMAMRWPHHLPISKANGGKVLDGIRLQPVDRLCQLAGAGGHITISIFDWSNVPAVSQSIRMTEDMLEVPCIFNVHFDHDGTLSAYKYLCKLFADQMFGVMHRICHPFLLFRCEMLLAK